MTTQTSLVKVPNTQQGTSDWGQKTNMVQITSVFPTASHRLPLCLLYSSHPSPFPNLHSFPSNQFHHPPKPSFHPKHSSNRSENEWKTLPRTFLVHFPSFFIGCNDVTLDRNHFSKKQSVNIFYLLLQNLVRIKVRVFFPKTFLSSTLQHNCPAFITNHIFAC